MKKNHKLFLFFLLTLAILSSLFLWHHPPAALKSTAEKPKAPVPTLEAMGSGAPETYSVPTPSLAVEKTESEFPSLAPSPSLTPTRTPSSTPAPTPVTLPENQETAIIRPSRSQGSSVFSDQQLNWSLTDYIFIGDSRTHAMADVTHGSGTWIYKDGAGYDWMMSYGFPEADKAVGEGTAVVIALGVNDVHNCSAYVSAINEQAAAWEKRGARIFYAAIGPVTSDPYVTNDQILQFNTTMFHQLNVEFLDVYNHLAVNGFATTDGIHYDSGTTRSVYQFLVDHIS